MKELSIEEKAKRYDEAIQRARQFMETPYLENSDDVVGYIFPELAESEDEKIRKELIEYIKDQQYSFISAPDCRDKYEEEDNDRYNSWIAWLEKQGSEPNWCHHKVDLSDCSEEYRKAYYDGWNNCNMQYSQCKSELDDVVKCLINGMKFYYEDNEEATWGTDKWSMPVKHIIEVLEKQGVQKPADKVESKFKEGDTIRLKDGDGRLWKIEKIREDGYTMIGHGDDETDFLFLDDKWEVVEQKPAWSEEDVVKINRIVACLENLNVADNDILLKDINWLKSLRPQNTWKPSDEQMHVLEVLVNSAKGFDHFDTLNSLYNDLKKL